MHVATMTTEHFEFQALGETAESAKEAVFEGFWRHVAEYGRADKKRIGARKLDSRYFVEADLASKCGEPGPARQEYRDIHFGGRGLEEWYGMRVTELQSGECARDGEVIS